jgi:hypothetical protein
LKRLIVLALVVVLVTVMSAPAALFAMGGNNNGGNGDCKKDRSGKCEYPKKVTICHKTGKGKFNKIRVSENAVPAHLRHGDTFPNDKGKCPKKDNGNNNHNGHNNNGNGKK